MDNILNAVNNFFAIFLPLNYFLWDFPTGCDWWTNIPILGEFSFAILLLLGGSIFLTFKISFVQIRHFKKGISLLTKKKEDKVGTSQLAAFFISLSGRVGAGNIVGVAGAITIGGPGAIFWMWLSAFFGMATAFTEATLAQIYKVRKGDEYVGGFTFYIQKIWGNKKIIGIGMCIMYLIYNMLSIPVHTYHVFTALSANVDEITGTTAALTDPVYYIIAVVIIVVIAIVTFGGIKRVVKFSDKVVPIMAIMYIGIIMILVVINVDKIPGFLSAVLVGAFKPSAIFGGAFGVAVSQGLKRGLLSNEAGMGTSTQVASISSGNHPCEQGFVQAIGVFVDTIIICSLTGFVVTAGALWENPNIDWAEFSLNKITVFLESVKVLVPGTSLDFPVMIFVAVSFGLFAFTTLLCDLTYTEIAANKISQSKKFITFTRILGACFFVPLGTLTVLAGLQLDNLWAVSDLINVILVIINMPTLFVGSKIVKAAYENYKTSNGKRFVSADIGIESDVWVEE